MHNLRRELLTKRLHVNDRVRSALLHNIHTFMLNDVSYLYTGGRHGRVVKSTDITEHTCIVGIRWNYITYQHIFGDSTVE